MQKENPLNPINLAKLYGMERPDPIFFAASHRIKANLSILLFSVFWVVSVHAETAQPETTEKISPSSLPNIVSGVEVYYGKKNSICHTMAKYLTATNRAAKNVMLKYLVKYEGFSYPQWREEPFEEYRDEFYEATKNTCKTRDFCREKLQANMEEVKEKFDERIGDNAKVMVAELDIDNLGVIRKVVQKVNDTTVLDGTTYLHSEGTFIILDEDSSLDDNYNRTQHSDNIVIFNKKTYLLNDGGDLLKIYPPLWHPENIHLIIRYTLCASKNKPN